MSHTLSGISERDLLKAVDDAYSAKAKGQIQPSYAKAIAAAFGYSQEQLESAPDESYMGLSCGNPVATATLKAGETALDLGSGGGIDVFLAAAKVGPRGQVIGLDMSSDMVSLARRNSKKKNLKPPHVAFVQASLTEALPIASQSIDCVLSNCVINLLPLNGKTNLFKEVHRVLKPGGRVVLDDIIAKQPLPLEIRDDLTSYINCISGIQLEEYKSFLLNAGFPDALFVETNHDLNAYYKAEDSCCSASSATPVKPTFDVNTWVASYQIYAVKTGNLAETDFVPALLRWWDAYPTAKASPALVTTDELAALIRDTNKTNKDFAVIDVRRDDHAGGHVRGSHQWAAQSFFDDLPAFFEQYGGVSRVIFYCGSSSGRGPRCAGWYQDYLNEIGATSSTAYVLQGGVKAWLAKFSDDMALVDKD